MENKTDLKSQLHEVRNEIWELESKKKDEINALEDEKVAPLLDEARKVRIEIANSIYKKYETDCELLKQKQIELQSAVDALNVQDAANLWHPAGTIVTLWETGGWSSTWRKGDKTGTVQVYDGTQEVASNVNSYNRPRKGDVVVFHNKKDGTMGLKFDIIASNGRLNNYFPNWLIEGETPTNNLRTKLRDKENAQEETPA